MCFLYSTPEWRLSTYSTKKIKVPFELNPLRALLDISSRMLILRENL